MKKIERVSKYVSDLFERYGMNTYGFFRDFDEETEETVDVPLFRYGKIDDETLEKISIYFGISKNEILSTDSDAALRYWNKYSFFSLYKQYRETWNWNHQYKDPKPTAEELLLNAIFSDKRGITVRYKYDVKSIKERLVELLKEYDKVIPGTYHKGAEITDLRISTQDVFSFPQCAEMISSFFDMVDRIKELFFKTIHADLIDDEINELNFLASFLDAYDNVDVKTCITYDNVACYKKIYQAENLSDFYDYVTIKSTFVKTCPWRCKEFFDDIATVQKFVDVFPETKGAMREFGINLTKFSCDFVWSDAKPITYSDEEEAELYDFEEVCGLEHTPIEDRAKEHTHIYVDKNRSEKYGLGEYIKALKKAYGPVAKGGIVVPNRKSFTFYQPGAFDRATARLDAKNKSGTANG